MNKRRFNSLPVEITKEIFCNIDSESLYDLRAVCSYWRDMIEEILDIQQLQVSDERFVNATYIFDRWKKYSNGRYNFSIHRAPYSIKNIVGKTVIGIHTNDWILDLYEITHVDVLEELECYALNGGAYSRSRCEDVLGSTWRTILAMTETQYSVEELRDKSFTDEVVASSLTNYKWYRYKSDRMMDIAWDVGLVALYPDNQTFAVLFATDTD